VSLHVFLRLGMHCQLCGLLKVMWVIGGFAHVLYYFLSAVLTVSIFSEVHNTTVKSFQISEMYTTEYV